MWHCRQCGRVVATSACVMATVVDDKGRHYVAPIFIDAAEVRLKCGACRAEPAAEKRPEARA